MNKLLQPENNNKKYESLFNEIDTGQIKLPMFQREFVWSKEKSSNLIDSIIKGFPIGTFILWKTREELRTYKEIGNHHLPTTPKGDYVQYILDGQQRITSLYAIRKGIRITKDGKEVDYRDIFINLSLPTDSEDPITTTDVPCDDDSGQFISVHTLLTSRITNLLDKYGKAELETIEDYKSKLTGYDFSTITITDYPIEIACEIFSRINTGGKSLTVFEIMVAKTYDEDKSFDLAERVDILRDGADDDRSCLSSVRYDTLPDSVIMQCVAAVTKGAARGRDILTIKRDEFIEAWQPTLDSLFTAIDFLRSELRIPVSKILPYPALVIPLTYFFFHTKNKKPTYQQIKLLEQYFYWSGINGRYSSSSDTKVTEDLSKVDQIIKELTPSYLPSEIRVSEESIAETHFSAGNAFCKAVLCALAFQQPRSFDTDGTVILDNSNLKIASSKNYHHFFPKQYLKETYPQAEANLIANITIIDGYSNKHRIGKKAPSDYIERFAKDNKNMSQTLASHLVLDIDNFGISENDYTQFINQRSVAIANVLNKKLNP
ncbi:MULTISPECIES: DUF262 domain-containing protein [Idiomarina]|jgi:hypothetical protein|uniref:DUF262 domain-containing protein n=1 Tax=Idiomarina TaxID=135575 RepID=UPI000C3EE5BF|nr:MULTISPECIES: DUF262 domain-containing protein [Idiomarina]MAO68415.1 hypothetical protein [Idiomarina sp.]MBF80741.1 hypothetical protein [Idiomarina sp.]|tara:strand:- start:31038 stop:32675 length:1638 start_codon:yes stop_codon:yes gene_type:complete